jgi:hypothetical protein
MQDSMIYRKPKQYHYCTVAFDGHPVNVEYERDEEGDGIYLTAADVGGVQIIEWLNKSTISSLENLIVENEKQQYVEFCIRH